MTAVDNEPQLSEEELAAEKERLDALRARYRTLPDMEARQRAIASEELPKLTSLPEPDQADLAWQETLIQEHYDLEKLAAPLKRRAAQMEAIARAHADPANREEPEPRRTPDLQTRNAAGHWTRSSTTPPAATCATSSRRTRPGWRRSSTSASPTSPSTSWRPAARSTTTRFASTCTTRRGCPPVRR